MNSSHVYQFEIPRIERKIIEETASEGPPEFSAMVQACFAQSPPTFTPFVLGALMSALADRRTTVPATWANLMAIRADLRKDSGITVRDLPGGMVEITAPGALIRRKKEDWE